MKFGGTSMGSAERIRVAARLAAEQHAKRPVAVVVSAMSKVTDLLLDSLRKAEAGDQADSMRIWSSSPRGTSMLPRAASRRTARKRALAGIEALIPEFSRIAKGMMMLGERPPRSMDEAMAMGERLSALADGRVSRIAGNPAAAVNAADVIATDAVFGNATPLMEPTRAARREGPATPARQARPAGGDRVQRLDPGRPADHARPRRLGFLGVDRRRRAGCRRAVDLDRRRRHHDRRSAPGPRRAGARRVTYAEAAELAYNGAKVLHPAHARAAGRAPDPGVEQEQLRAGKARHAHRPARSSARRARTRSPPWPTSRWSRSSPPARP